MRVFAPTVPVSVSEPAPPIAFSTLEMRSVPAPVFCALATERLTVTGTVDAE